MRAIDLFAGAGGFSTGAQMAGVEVVWAANHWPVAVETHAANHPETAHVCQGQHQVANGGNAKQSQSSRNDNASNASNANTNASQGNTTSTNVSVAGDTVTYRAAASMAYAPPIAPTALCMGSSSAGGSGMTFGFSIGTSWTDSNCVLLEQVRTVAAVLGDKEIASAMMCRVDAYREAREASGKPCL